MSRKLSTHLLMAIFGVLIVALFSTEVAYQTSREYTGRVFSDNIAFLIIAACVLSGVVAIALHRGWTPVRRLIISVVYLPLMSFVLLITMFFYMLLRGAVAIH